jgi:phosphoglycerate kinase
MLDHSIGEQVNVAFAPDCVGDLARELANKLEDGKVLLLENLHFYAEERPTTPHLKKLWALPDLCERRLRLRTSRPRFHEGITHFAQRTVAGLLMEKELNLGKALTNPAKPFVAILGGARFPTKSGHRTSTRKVDAILIGGGMAYTFQGPGHGGRQVPG